MLTQLTPDQKKIETLQTQVKQLITSNQEATGKIIALIKQINELKNEMSALRKRMKGEIQRVESRIK